jgi:hypothetical protein
MAEERGERRPYTGGGNRFEREGGKRPYQGTPRFSREERISNKDAARLPAEFREPGREPSEPDRPFGDKPRPFKKDGFKPSFKKEGFKKEGFKKPGFTSGGFKKKFTGKAAGAKGAYKGGKAFRDKNR